MGAKWCCKCTWESFEKYSENKIKFGDAIQNKQWVLTNRDELKLDCPNVSNLQFSLHTWVLFKPGKQQPDWNRTRALFSLWKKRTQPVMQKNKDDSHKLSHRLPSKDL